MQGLGSCDQLLKISNYLKISWCWERLKVAGERDDRGWDGWMASPTQWTWVWVNSGSWWWTGRPGMLQSMGSQKVGHDRATELNWKSSWSSVPPSPPWTPFRVCQRSTATASQDSTPEEADGKCPWQVPVCPWHSQDSKGICGRKQEWGKGDRRFNLCGRIFFVDQWLCLLKISVR